MPRVVRVQQHRPGPRGDATLSGVKLWHRPWRLVPRQRPDGGHEIIAWDDPCRAARLALIVQEDDRGDRVIRSRFPAR